MSAAGRAADAPGRRLLARWQRIAGFPFGRELFSWALGREVPYSGALGACVRVLEPGRAVVELRERRAVRNHLHSVHAIALANLGELTSGMAMTTALPADVRGIVTGLNVTYAKKARGRLVAESRVTVPEVRGDVEHDVEHDVAATIRDDAGDVVAEVTVRWRLGPREGA